MILWSLGTAMTREYSKNKVLEFIKDRKERIALIGVIVICILAVGGGIILQKTRRPAKEFQPDSASKTMEQKLPQKKEGVSPTENVSQVAPFSRTPLPDELLQQLASLENFNEDAQEAKYTGLRVIWSTYFFSLQKTTGNKATLVLDVDENGFGVVIEGEIDTQAYPQVRDLDPGEKLWVGGAIQTVDRSGTGTIYLKIEHIKVGDDPTVPANQPSAN